MGKLIVSENVTLDGVVADPTGEEGSAYGGWFLDIQPDARAAWADAALAEALKVDGLLLGRRTYEFFASRWPERTGPLAEALNGLPKYVVSSTLEDLQWSGSVLLGSGVPAAVGALKAAVPGPIVVFGSGQLVPMLFTHGLVDELRLTVYPHVAGSGARLFEGATAHVPLELVSSETIGGALPHLMYRVAGQRKANPGT